MTQQIVTPSGIEILFETEPKRRYLLRSPERPDGSHNFDWFEVPSVTTALESLDKPGLSWWGMETGTQGLASLLRSRTIVLADDGLLYNPTAFEHRPLTVEEISKLLTQYKLCVNTVKRKAGDRGQAVHDALELWAAGQEIDVSIFPVESQGYVHGLLGFLRDVPSAEPVASEVMVGSLEHGFAGRYDIRFRTTQEHAVCVHRTPVRGPQWASLPPGLYLGDLKTSKHVYPKSHFRQLEGYEGASLECGYESTDGRGIIHVGPQGTYEFVRSVATYQHFLDALTTYRGDLEIHERSKKK